ncbi:MAG TPA: hypothetical protein PKZ20_04475, partial [Rhodocyclaceae bacterium]|nr:hypothetical protein [Rhodocyclaceae bacterium]
TLSSTAKTLSTAAKMIRTHAKTLSTSAQTLRTAAKTLSTHAQTLSTAAKILSSRANRMRRPAQDIHRAHQKVRVLALLETPAPHTLASDAPRHIRHRSSPRARRAILRGR